jgi:D-threo-aldose 1-dehydrogenase
VRGPLADDEAVTGAGSDDGGAQLPVRLLTGQGLPFTEISLGCSQLGNLYREMADDTARAIVDRAWQLGVRYFDTAPHYGLGLSERRLGAALSTRDADSYVVSSKVGRLLVPRAGLKTPDSEGFAVPATHRRVWDFTRDGIRRSVQDSLQRTGLAGLDVAYLHDPDDHMAEVLVTGYPALEEMRDEGLISAIGAGMNAAEPLARLVRETDVDLVMLAGRYTLLEQESLDELLPACTERGVGVVIAGVFNSGLLARDEPDDTARYDYTDAPPMLLERARAIARICREHGTTLPAAALAFPLAHEAVVSVCVGASSPEQIERSLSLYRTGVPSSLWPELKKRGLLRPDAPTPIA